MGERELLLGIDSGPTVRERRAEGWGLGTGEELPSSVSDTLTWRKDSQETCLAESWTCLVSQIGPAHPGSSCE